MRVMRKALRSRALQLPLAVLLLTAMLPVAPAAGAAATPMVATGIYHTIGLKSDGTVVAVGDADDGQCDVSAWTDIVAIAANGFHTLGVKSDGTVVATGDNEYGQCDVSTWTDIVAVAGGYYHTVGLKADGTAVATGRNHYGQCDVSTWTDIVAVAGGYYHTIGLKANGTVVAVGDNNQGQCDVSTWTDVVAVASGAAHTVGVKADGTVVATGWNPFGECDVSTWTDIVAAAAGEFFTVGLKEDGTLVATGENNWGVTDVSAWTGIVALSGTCRHTVGLKANGVVLAAGWNGTGQCNVSAWDLSLDDAAVSVSADAPAPTELSLTFSVTAGTAPEGGGVTDSSIDFGTLAANTPKTGSHVLQVTTNASNGYQVTGAESAPLTSGAYTIPDVTGDAGNITESVAGAWVQATTYGFGYTLADTAGTSAAFTSGYKQFADTSAAESAQIVMGATAPTTGDAVELTYKLNIGPAQVQGTYTNTVTYIATGNL